MVPQGGGPSRWLLEEAAVLYTWALLRTYSESSSVPVHPPASKQSFLPIGINFHLVILANFWPIFGHFWPFLVISPEMHKSENGKVGWARF